MKFSAKERRVLEAALNLIQAKIEAAPGTSELLKSSPQVRYVVDRACDARNALRGILAETGSTSTAAAR